MNGWNYRPQLLFVLAMLGTSIGRADTIDPNKPISASLEPDILYFSFDEGAAETLSSGTGLPFLASVEPGKAGARPTWKPSRNATFGEAVEFNYGENASFTEVNEKIAGNHLSIPDHATLRLAGQSFTMGAWVQIPKNAEIPSQAYKKIMGKGAYSESYPGWSLQISKRDYAWVMTFLMAAVDAPLTRVTAQLPGGLQPGAWHHLAVSVNAEEMKVALWFDGAVVQTQEVATDIGESTVPLFIGENGMSLYCNIPLTMDEVFIVSGTHQFYPIDQ